MYDAYDSDSYFFNNEITFLLEQKNKDAILSIIKEKHINESKEYIPVSTKRNDLLIWNVIYIREIIKQGTTKQFIHNLYNKFYREILSSNSINALQALELNIATAYLDILINSIEVTDNFIINKVISYLYIRLEDNLTIEEISNELKISKGYLSRAFKEKMNISVMNYFKKIKIDRAKTLLKSTNKSILEISSQLSFCDQGNFTKTFKSICAITPTKYRNSHLNKTTQGKD